MPCKTVTCCDLDDFPQQSSSEGNCPVGWQWDGVSCVRCAVPAAGSIYLDEPGIISVVWDVPEGVSFRIERQEESGPFVQKLAYGTGAIGDSLESFSDTNVVVGRRYSYRIAVYQSAQCGYIEGEIASAVAV